jgi:hypothetical protein
LQGSDDAESFKVNTIEEEARQLMKNDPVIRAGRTNGMFMRFSDFCDILEWGSDKKLDRFEIAKSIISEHMMRTALK